MAIAADTGAVAFLAPSLVLQSEPVQPEAGLVNRITEPAVIIRKEFPETWIWDLIDDTGCENYFKLNILLKLRGGLKRSTLFPCS